MDAYGTIHYIAAGSEFDGTQPVITPRQSRGIDLYEALTAGGAIKLPLQYPSKISFIGLNLDATAHAPIACEGNLSVFISGTEFVLDKLTNESSYVYNGGPFVVPPGSIISISFVNAIATTQIQTFVVMHAPSKEML